MDKPPSTLVIHLKRVRSLGESRHQKSQSGNSRHGRSTASHDGLDLQQSFGRARAQCRTLVLLRELVIANPTLLRFAWQVVAPQACTWGAAPSAKSLIRPSKTVSP